MSKPGDTEHGKNNFIFENKIEKKKKIKVHKSNYVEI